MSKRNVQNVIAMVKDASPDVILRAAALCDGHSIFDPKAFVNAGLPQLVVEYLIHTHQSDGSPKGTIFTGGQPVQELRGIYGLDALRFFASALGVEYRRAMGRGFEAANIQTALRQHFHPSGKPAV